MVHDLGTITAKPGQEVCDFCSSQPVKWSFPVRGDHIIGEVQAVRSLVESGAKVGIGSSGAWAACQACYVIIRRADRDGLAKRSAKKFMRKHDLPRSALPRIVKTCREAHDSFWKERQGDPVEFDPRA